MRGPGVSALLRWLTIFAISLPAMGVEAADLVKDREVTLHSTRQVREKRRQLIEYLWGTEGFPKERVANMVVSNVPSPVKQLSHLERVDELRMEMAPGLQGLAYHFIADHPNRWLVVVHHGHACTLDDDPSPR